MNTGITDKKQLLKQPEAFIEQLDDSRKKQAQQLIRDHREYKNALKQLKTRQGILSARIGELKKQQQAVDDVLAEIKSVSQQTKEQKERLSDCETELLALFQTSEEKTARASDSPAESLSLQPVPEEWQVVVKQVTTTDANWNQLLHNCPHGSFYHQSGWAGVIQKSFGHKPLYLAAYNQHGEMLGLLPLIHMQSRLFGNFLVSMPYFNYGGAVSCYRGVTESLMESAEQYAADRGCSHIEFRNSSAIEGYPARTDKVNMYLALPETTDTLWQGFTKKLRAQIRRPQRENTRVATGGLELLNDYYRVFSENMRDLGTPVYGKQFFANILSAFPGHATLIIVYLDNKPVSAGFLMKHGDMLEIPWASTLRRVNHLSINMLLYWSVLEFAIDSGCKCFDFGRSSKDAGTYRFKKQWGATPKQLYWHYFLPKGEELPTINPSNPKYALFIALWKRLPLFIANRLGPLIVKNIP